MTDIDEFTDLPVFVEIKRHSNVKYELNKETFKLEIDRMLHYPYFYPYAYGFFLNTIAGDGDELDALIISNNQLKNDIIIKGAIVGGLMMEDEGGIDEKIFVVPSHELEEFENMRPEKKAEIYEDIAWFFSNYKNKELVKWSKVHSTMSREDAIATYKKCRIPQNNK